MRALGVFVRSPPSTAQPPLPSTQPTSPARLPRPDVPMDVLPGDGFPDDTWVEIARVDYNHPLESCAAWYLAARGSGIWWNTGRSHVAAPKEPGEETVQHRYFVQGSCYDPTSLLLSLINSGVQTLQLPHDFNNNAFELVDLRFWNDPTYATREHYCAGEYRSGWNAQAPCACHLIGRWMIGCRAQQEYEVPCVAVGG